MGTGEAFVKWLKPAGCALFLVLAILMTVTLFTAKGAPVKGYEAPESSEYYAENLSELASELESNMFPLMDAPASCAVSDGKIVVTAPKEKMPLVRNGIVYYYDEKLFEFHEE